jgi:eukaryotic-like serine/threonine-protein kinase
MYNPGDVIAEKYTVEGICSDSGGMGKLLHVTPVGKDYGFRVVLKYCKHADEEQLKRFRREVRLLASFRDNSRIVQIVDSGPDHDPPYFVMKFYQDGDLQGVAPQIQASPKLQEKYFLQMIDCIQELHTRNEFHRDIKPQNFLRDGENIVVSDFGLSTELGSQTAFTRSSIYWGTPGFIPPEFLNGGFKHADATGDIFMLGKTFYVMLTGRDPMYIMGDGVAPPIFHIIERSCSNSKASRYQSLAEMKQSIVAAYDVILGRAGGLGKTKQLLSAILDRIAREHQYSAAEVSSFVEQLGVLEEEDQIRLCQEVPHELYQVLGQKPLANILPTYLAIYRKLVEAANYAWSYAETIAANMRLLFDGAETAQSQKIQALELAIRAATLMNRFAAMNTCTSMVASINDETFGLGVGALILKHRGTFIADMEASACQVESIRAALRQVKEK